MEIPGIFGFFKDTILVMPPTSMAVLGILLTIVIALGFHKSLISWKQVNHYGKWRRSTLNFSDVQSLPFFDLASTQPHPYRPWRAGRYHMTMGIRKMPEEDWLVLDNLYEKEQEFRQHLLENNRSGVIQYLPGSEAACEETLECVIKFLTKRFPSHFCHPKGDLNYTHNLITNKTFKITPPFEQHPLEVAAQLTMEDINLLIQGRGRNRVLSVSTTYLLKTSS
jgi:hypothetical protein